MGPLTGHHEKLKRGRGLSAGGAFGSPRSGRSLYDRKWSILRWRPIKWLRTTRHSCVSAGLRKIAVGTSTTNTRGNIGRIGEPRDIVSVQRQRPCGGTCPPRAGRVTCALRGSTVRTCGETTRDMARVLRDLAEPSLRTMTIVKVRKGEMRNVILISAIDVPLRRQHHAPCQAPLQRCGDVPSANLSGQLPWQSFTSSHVCLAGAVALMSHIYMPPSVSRGIFTLRLRLRRGEQAVSRTCPQVLTPGTNGCVATASCLGFLR